MAQSIIVQSEVMHREVPGQGREISIALKLD